MRCSRSLRPAFLLSILTVAAGGAGVFASNDLLRPEVLDTFLRMRIAAAALDTQAIEAPIPGPTPGFVPLSWMRDRLTGRLRAHLTSLRDAWRNPILYWSDGQRYALISFGSDGEPQFSYDADPPYAGVNQGWAGSNPADDLIIVDGAAFRGPMSQREQRRRAMSEMRSTATACESYAVDTNVYPGPVEPVDVVARIATDLEPIYIRHLPRTDPWGQPYRFWSDARGYAIVSYGADGDPDTPYTTWGRAEFETLPSGPTTGTGQDLIFFEGQFVQWPSTIPR